MSTLEAQADAAAGRGDYPAARDALGALVAAGQATTATWTKLAVMCRALGDAPGARAAVEAALALQPLDFVALLLRADMLDAAGDAAAGEAYGHALAQRPAGEVPPAIARRIAVAEVRARAHAEGREAVLAAATAPAEARADPDAAHRIARFRSNIVRRTAVYHSEPTAYHYPGLVEREFHDRADHPWLAGLEAATDAIAADLERVTAAERAELVPYVQYAPGIPLRQWAGLNGSRDWTAIHLLRRGERVEANARHCAATLAALAALPQPDVPGRMPNAMFSLLAPGARIPPHTGVANTRLIVHLPLVVPPGCWFRVGAETRAWRRGEAFVFDDTIEHEAANEGEALRVVLIADVWHPGLGDLERAAVAAAMQAGDEAVDGL